MGFINQSDVQRLVHDQDLMSEVAKAIVEDPAMMDDLADDIADKLDDELEDSPEMKKLIVDAAIANPEFKKRIVTKLVQDLG
jgi:hypothetical protein